MRWSDSAPGIGDGQLAATGRPACPAPQGAIAAHGRHPRPSGGSDRGSSDELQIVLESLQQVAGLGHVSPLGSHGVDQIAPLRDDPLAVGNLPIGILQVLTAVVDGARVSPLGGAESSVGGFARTWRSQRGSLDTGLGEQLGQVVSCVEHPGFDGICRNPNDLSHLLDRFFVVVDEVDDLPMRRR